MHVRMGCYRKRYKQRAMEYPVKKILKLELNSDVLEWKRKTVYVTLKRVLIQSCGKEYKERSIGVDW